MAHSPTPIWRTLLPGQRTEVRVYDVTTGEDTLVYASETELLEAPNWHPNGEYLVLNYEGGLVRVPLSGGAPEPIDTGGRGDLNNDHVLSPDGRTVYVTAKDGHLYSLPISGGVPARITRENDGLVKHYLHGISADGTLLSIVGLSFPHGPNTPDFARFRVAIVRIADGALIPLSSAARPEDGAEFGPDGALYFNAEPEGSAPGHAQLHRIGATDIQATLGEVKDPTSPLSIVEILGESAFPFRTAAEHIEDCAPPALYGERSPETVATLADGSGTEHGLPVATRLTDDERVNWFPHPSPDGAHLLWLSYPAGTLGHPENLDVELRLGTPDAAEPRTLVRLYGGQGTTNVNGWAPDSTRFAYVAYPIG
ncbi:biopolymer transporter Tol [Mycetocola tolaasinivorans]|uniref:Biopolymer transporter Tol n=1 Tax=Mycetocola tolaasinivorans TaxID=76635 RepID=A0A3L7A3P7_9MICO|nr:biopolymer transporter Tol [Mycetocola tolaasinivorans]RLP74568.1 biopolymer transporter Tol [Mycetocola tolaasinivorans]